MRLTGHRRGPAAMAAKAYRQARPPARDTPWREAPYVVVDLETTGLDPRRDEIISYAAIPVTNGRIVVGGAESTLIRPAQMPGATTIRIHGLRPDDLAGAPTLPDALEPILRSLAGRVLVAHAAWVERGFLAAALRHAGVRSLAKPVLDTAALARHALEPQGLPEGDPPPLGEVAKRLGLPVHRPHVAEGDALTTAQVFLALATRLDRRHELQTVESLARLSAS